MDEVNMIDLNLIRRFIGLIDFECYHRQHNGKQHKLECTTKDGRGFIIEATGQIFSSEAADICDFIMGARSRVLDLVAEVGQLRVRVDALETENSSLVSAITVAERNELVAVEVENANLRKALELLRNSV